MLDYEEQRIEAGRERIAGEGFGKITEYPECDLHNFMLKMGSFELVDKLITMREYLDKKYGMNISKEVR